MLTKGDVTKCRRTASSMARKVLLELSLSRSQPGTKLRTLRRRARSLPIPRVQAREEDGRLAVDLDGTHHIVDGAELAEDQSWYLD